MRGRRGWGTGEGGETSKGKVNLREQAIRENRTRGSNERAHVAIRENTRTGNECAHVRWMQLLPSARIVHAPLKTTKQCVEARFCPVTSRPFRSRPQPEKERPPDHTCAHLHTMMTHTHTHAHTIPTDMYALHEIPNDTGLPLLPHCLSSTTVFSIFAFLPSPPANPFRSDRAPPWRKCQSRSSRETPTKVSANTIPHDHGESIFGSKIIAARVLFADSCARIGESHGCRASFFRA